MKLCRENGRISECQLAEVASFFFHFSIPNSNNQHFFKQMKPFHFLTSSSLPPLLFVTTIALLYGVFYGTSTGGDPIDQCGGGLGESVSREFFPMEGDVAWVVQITDLHLSAHHPEIGEDLKYALSSALRVIRPSLVFITGDITGNSVAFYVLTVLRRHLLT